MAAAATPPSSTLKNYPTPLAFQRPILKRRLSFSYLVDFKFLYLRERQCVSPPLCLSASAIKIHAHSLLRPRPRRRAQLRPLGRRRWRQRRWKSCKFLIKCGRDSASEASVNTIKGPGGHELKMVGTACDPADVPDDHGSHSPLSFIDGRVSMPLLRSNQTSLGRTANLYDGEKLSCKTSGWLATSRWRSGQNGAWHLCFHRLTLAAGK